MIQPSFEAKIGTALRRWPESDGLAIATASLLVPVIVIANLLLMTRSLGLWYRGNGSSDALAAKDAAACLDVQ
jgi:hypothetical protein